MFEEYLKTTLNKFGSNNFTRIIKADYEKYKKDFDELFNKLGQTDWKYINLYIQNKLNKCPVCGRYCIKKTCSKECSKKHSYSLNEFKELLKNNTFKNSLINLMKKYGNRKFTNYAIKLYAYFKTEFDELFKEIGSNDFTFIQLYLNDKLSKCECCGKIIKAPRLFCSIKCSLMKRDYSKIDYSNRGNAISKAKRGKKIIFKNGHPAKLHILNVDKLTKDYIENNFNENGVLKINDILSFYNISESFFNKVKNNLEIKIPNERLLNGGISNAEKNLFKWIPTDNKISNTKQIIKPYELDIYLPDFKLAIEYNGSYWHSEGRKGKEYHLNKTDLCNEKGIQLLHIFDFDDLDIWKSMISNKLGLHNKIYARKCIFKELEYKEIKDFLKTNHLQGSCSSKINLGLFYENELVQVMTFGKPRFNKKYDYELLRLCSKKYTNVVGGASKLFKYFTRKYKGSIISYANRRFSNGNIYKQLGFKELNKTEPNYWYVKEDKILSRYQCQKHKLNSLLENFNPKLSESENMALNGYFRIYDCGNIVYEFVSS